MSGSAGELPEPGGKLLLHSLLVPLQHSFIDEVERDAAGAVGAGVGGEGGDASDCLLQGCGVGAGLTFLVGGGEG